MSMCKKTRCCGGNIRGDDTGVRVFSSLRLVSVPEPRFLAKRDRRNVQA